MHGVPCTQCVSQLILTLLSSHYRTHSLHVYSTYSNLSAQEHKLYNNYRFTINIVSCTCVSCCSSYLSFTNDNAAGADDNAANEVYTMMPFSLCLISEFNSLQNMHAWVYRTDNCMVYNYRDIQDKRRGFITTAKVYILCMFIYYTRACIRMQETHWTD